MHSKNTGPKIQSIVASEASFDVIHRLPKSGQTHNDPENDTTATEVTVGAMFGRDGLFMGASALQLVSGLLLTPLLTRVLGPNGFGQFAANIALFYVLIYLLSLGLNTGIQRVEARSNRQSNSRELLATSIFLVSLLALVVFISGPFWSPILGFGHFKTAEKLTVVWSTLSAITLISLALLRSRDRLIPFAIISLLQSVGSLGVGIIIALLYSRTLTDVLWGAVTVQTFAVLLGLLVIPPAWRGILDWRLTHRTLLFCLPLVPQQVASFIIAAADRFVIQRDLGSGPTGRYQVAYSVGALAINLLAFLNQAWLPRIFSIRDTKERASVLQTSRDALFGVLVPVTLGLTLGGPVVLQVWAPANFHTAGLTMVLILVVASTFPLCAALSSVRALLAQDKSIVVAAATIGAALVNLILNLILVPSLKINGSALATLISYGALALFLTLCLKGAEYPSHGSRKVWLEIAAANIVLFASWYVPLGSGWTTLRLGVSAICLLWTGWIVRRLLVSAEKTSMVITR